MFALLVLHLAACANPADALTNAISFEGGTLINGDPPASTNGASDPVLHDGGGGGDTGGGGGESVVYGGMQGAMGFEFDLPEGAAVSSSGFQINVQFDGASSYHSISLPSDNLVVGGYNTVSIPFYIDPSVCDQLDKQYHAIKCNETVYLGGSSISNEMARDLQLACEEQMEGTCYESSGCDDGGSIQSCANSFGECWYEYNGTQYTCGDGCDCYDAAEAAVNACMGY